MIKKDAARFKTHIGTDISLELCKRLDAFANKETRSRANAIVLLVERALDDEDKKPATAGRRARLAEEYRK